MQNDAFESEKFEIKISRGGDFSAPRMKSLADEKQADRANPLAAFPCRNTTTDKENERGKQSREEAQLPDPGLSIA